METVMQEATRLSDRGDNSWCNRRWYVWTLFVSMNGFDYYGERHRALWDILFEEMTLPKIAY